MFYHGVHRDHGERELVNLFYNNNSTNFLNCAMVKDDLIAAESRMLESLLSVISSEAGG